MKKLFSVFAVFALVCGCFVLSACGKEAKIGVSVVGELPDGIEQVVAEDDNGKCVVTKSRPVIYFRFEEQCKWGGLTLTVMGVKADKTEEVVLQDGTYLESGDGDVKIYQDMGGYYGYKLGDACFGTYEQVKLSFSGEAELRMTKVGLSVENSYTEFDTNDLRFNVKTNKKLVAVEGATDLTFDQFKGLFVDGGIGTPYGKEFEVDAWEINQQSLRIVSLTAGEFKWDKHFFKYENGVLKTVLIIKAGDSDISLNNSTAEWFGQAGVENSGAIGLTLNDWRDYSGDLFSGNQNEVTRKIYAGQEEITSFDGLKEHINDKLTIKFECDTDYTLLDYLAENAKFEVAGQKVTVKKESAGEGKVVYVVENITNPFQTHEQFTFLVAPVFEEAIKLDGLMIAPSVFDVGYSGTGDQLFDELGNNCMTAIYDNQNHTYVLKDSKYFHSYEVNEYNSNDIKSKKLTVTYAKGKTLSFTLADDLSGHASDENATLTSTINGENKWVITFTLNKTSICDLETITFELK